MRRWKWLVLCAIMTELAYEVHVYAQTQLQRLMAEKLQAAQRILEGIAIGDFDKTTNNAEALLALANRAEWLAYKTNRYELHSNEFRRAAETIIQKSKAKNLDGVTLAYMDLTMSCVRCHQHVREIRDARLPLPPVQGEARPVEAE